MIAALAAAAALPLAALGQKAPPAMLVAPMMGLDPCWVPVTGAAAQQADTAAMIRSCNPSEGSAGPLVEQTLAGLLPANGRSRSFELGYTLNVPLLTLFTKQGEQWKLNPVFIEHIARTVRDTKRPVIVYLFSTHFSQSAPIEKALAADPANLGWTPKGPLGEGVYYSAPIYNWTFADTDNGITRRRVEAAQAVLDALCRLEPAARERIRGVTLLGELHHLFPDFEAGMGFDRPYLVTDYSATSKQNFRAFLRQRFGTIEKLNQAVGAGWKSFDAVEPPSKNIRSEPLKGYTEHIDSFAHGFIPITGWAFDPKATTARPGHVRILLNGQRVARIAIDQSRQDVLAALPQLGSANVGWRYDLDFRKLPYGLHRIEVLLEDGANKPILLASRQVAIMDRQQSTPKPQPQAQGPATRPLDAGTRAHVDVPADLSSYFYNPLVPLWHEFRGQQVVDYLLKFNGALKSCLDATVPRFTHQIIPFTNPGWDHTKFAIEASLKKLPGVGMGVSLYGEPTYGTSFSDWLRRNRPGPYGITEFHPLKTLAPAELGKVFRTHARQGAQFLSFFMEPRWNGHRTSRHINLFSLDPENKAYGSDKLYEGVRAVLADPKAAAGLPLLPAPAPAPAAVRRPVAPAVTAPLVPAPAR
ncbi:beta-galactosidase [Caenimonas sedimenti]|uniref:beta-galactosidase n=1 Tax=Caenimonas sedimenti TaxID=2596921 RepID=UPI0021020C54|nr:beta-galactosidase [Caenimonas sedimenti]